MDSVSYRLVARWMLLFCTLFGLATMHTIGHTTHTGHPGHAGAGGVHAASVHAAPPCPDGHCDGPGAPGGWSVCVAVLQGLGAAVLLALLLLTVLGGHGRVRIVAAAAGWAPRAPPERTTGLTIAATSVLRI